MKVIATAKIIAARISLLFWAGDWFMPPPFAIRAAIPPRLRVFSRRNAHRLLAWIRNRRRLRSRRRDLRRPLAQRQPPQRRRDGCLPWRDGCVSFASHRPRHLL